MRMNEQLELWGGAECSIVRIGDRWRDQIAETGHRDRAEDVDLIAQLGVRKVRLPILWEATAPECVERCDFAWAEERIARLSSLGIGIIGGLLHHGSGPAYTDLLDPDFSRRFAEFAARVADRFPQIREWALINEPLTTARFACLYGHWYPHRSDYPAFLRALVNQCDAIRRAVASIRTVDSAAAFIQTEDVGKVFATPPLAHQADHENQRRWLSLDLLVGRLDGYHPFRPFLADAGIEQAELDVFADGSAAPDLIGVNHYLTSERFLDHRVELYPGLARGGNGRDVYVDAEAVRVAQLDRERGIAARLRETWQRYHIPLAVTEVHHGCTREEQLRWLAEVWGAAGRVRREGVPVTAVTLWSLFGAIDWRSLMTRDEGRYDAGAFDVRAPTPRPTLLARAAQSYARTGQFRHPALDGPGWWRRADRLYPWCLAGPSKGSARPLLITGATGTLGRAMARIAAHRGLAHRLTSRAELDISDPASIAAAIREIRPWAIVNAAGFVRVDDAEREFEACMAANAAGPANLARACSQHDLPLVTFSSDLVFDGLQGRACREGDMANPTGAYGRSKLAAERMVSATGARALIIRTSAFFGPWDRYNFAWSVIEALRLGQPVSASASDRASPTFVPDLCHAALDLLLDGEVGIWHLANDGAIDWHGFAKAIAAGAGLDADLIFARIAHPARNTALVSERGTLLRPLADALRDYLHDVTHEEAGAVLAPAGAHSATPASTA